MPRPPITMSFRFKGNNFFITYPKCPASKIAVLDFFKSLSPSPNYIHITREEHQDGSHNLHCFVQFSTEFPIRDPKKLDLNYESASYHPNIQMAKNPQDVLDYINKDGDIIKEGRYEIKVKHNNQHYYSSNEVWAYIHNTSSSAEEFLKKCEELQPRAFIMRYRALIRTANREWAPQPQVYTPVFYDFPNLSHKVQQWLLQNVCCLHKPDKPISLIMEGGSWLGKTEWARSIGPHNYFSGDMNFNYYSNSAKYNVIDNIRFRNCKYKEELLGAKHDWTANVRYGKPVKILGGIPTIVLCNPHMSWDREMSPSFKEWLGCNVIYEFINGPLY